jgi:hypothetical protein
MADIGKPLPGRPESEWVQQYSNPHALKPSGEITKSETTVDVDDVEASEVLDSPGMNTRSKSQRSPPKQDLSFKSQNAQPDCGNQTTGAHKNQSLKNPKADPKRQDRSTVPPPEKKSKSRVKGNTDSILDPKIANVLAEVEGKFRVLDSASAPKKTLETKLPPLGRLKMAEVFGEVFWFSEFILHWPWFIGGLGTKHFPSVQDMASDSHQIWTKIPSALLEDGCQARGWTNDKATLPIQKGKGMAKIPVESLRDFVRDLVDKKIQAVHLNEEGSTQFLRFISYL